MANVVIILLAVAVVALGVVLLRSRSGSGDVGALKEELVRMQERIAAQNGVLNQRLEGIDTRMSFSQSSNQDLAQGIFETLGDVRRATAEVADRAKEFSALQDLLRAPKPRGGLGEAMLEELLRQVLPPSAFEMQHRFESGTIVDAVVIASGRLICIDSKFPLANYQRMCDADDDAARAAAERAFAHDVDKHIKDISSRYIVPDEGTLDLAVMYVPAEGVYGQILGLDHRGRPLFETALEQRVVPMSPLTLYGYLQTVLFGLKCLQISKDAEAILGFCGQLQQDVARFADSYRKLGGHLTNARTQFEEGTRKLDRFQDRLQRVGEASAETEDGPRLLAVGDPEATATRAVR